MTRILVYGSADPDDLTMVHNTLCEVNKTYGPITCVIHANHTQALAWQAWVSRKQVTRHLPILEDWAHDGTLAQQRCIAKMFAANPDYVVMFTATDRKDRTTTKRTALLLHFADKAMVPVLTYDSPLPARGHPIIPLKYAEVAA